MLSHTDRLHFGFPQQMMAQVTYMFVQLTQIQNFLWSPWRFDNYLDFSWNSGNHSPGIY